LASSTREEGSFPSPRVTGPASDSSTSIKTLAYL
jgi:hypothetical protein